MKDWFDTDIPSRHLPAPLPIPSILDLGRLAHAAERLTDLTPDPTRADIGQGRVDMLFDREKALHDLLLTFRGQTMRDVATHLYVGYLAAGDLQNNDHELPPHERNRLLVTLRRVFLSTIPVVAEAAALDLAEIGAEYIPDYAAREFPVEA